VLQAEAAAAQAVAECERRAEQIVHTAQARAQGLIKRADQRITAIQMRCNHRIDGIIRAMQHQQVPQDGAGQPSRLGREAIETVLAALAAELTGGDEDAEPQRPSRP